MRRKTTTRVIGGLLVSIVFLLIAIGPAAASNYYFPTANSDATIISNNNGNILSYYPPPEIPHDINNGDSVIVRYNGTWDDQRGSPSLLATYYYNVSGPYASNLYYASYTKYLYGATSGWHIISIIIPNVQTPSKINITYNATLTLPSYYESHEVTFEYSFI